MHSRNTLYPYSHVVYSPSIKEVYSLLLLLKCFVFTNINIEDMKNNRENYIRQHILTLMRYLVIVLFAMLCLEGVGRLSLHALSSNDPVYVNSVSLRVTSDSNSLSPVKKAVICTRGYGGFANFMFGVISCYALAVLLHRPLYCIRFVCPHE